MAIVKLKIKTTELLKSKNPEKAADNVDNYFTWGFCLLFSLQLTYSLQAMELESCSLGNSCHNYRSESLGIMLFFYHYIQLSCSTDSRLRLRLH